MHFCSLRIVEFKTFKIDFVLCHFYTSASHIISLFFSLSMKDTVYKSSNITCFPLTFQLKVLIVEFIPEKHTKELRFKTGVKVTK